VDGPGTAQEPGAGDGGDAGPSRPNGAPWRRFALIFSLLAISSEIAYYAFVLESRSFERYLEMLAHVSGRVLELLGRDVTVRGVLISDSGFAVMVAHGCDALQVCALLSAAVIAFPAPLGRKVRGILGGVLLLQVLNLLRIVSLFLIGASFASIFSTVHEVVWPGVLIVITIATWIVWVRRETRSESGSQHSAAA